MKRRSLKANTAYLYLLTASNYLLGFITVPYQTRILGPEAFGIVGFAIAISAYFNLFLDYGFILSGTKSVSEAAKENRNIGKILSNITYAKIILFLILSLIFCIITFFVKQFRGNILILSLYLLLSLANSLLPDYLYRGIEDMKKLTYRAVLTRGGFTLLIFVFMKNPSQYYFVPLFQLIGSVAALVWTYYDVRINLRITFGRSHFREIYNSIKESTPYFLSRIATTIYNGTNTIIIGFKFTDSMVGLYTSGTKFRVLFNMAEAPLTDSLYPYMTRTRDFSKLLRIALLAELPIIIFCIFIWIFAEQLCIFVFGHEYAGAAPILKLTVPLIAIGFPGKLFGFPALTPLGKQNWANWSNIVAMANQLVCLTILFIIDRISINTLIYSTILSESLGVLIRIIVFVKYYNVEKHFK